MGLLVQKSMEVSNSFTVPKTLLIVGLGNIGDQYTNNRHNAGFLCLESLADNGYTAWTEKSRLRAHIAEKTVSGDKVILAKPTTLMNDSGAAVQAIAQFYRIPIEDILVIYDEADIEFGTIRSRVGGGSAGHNGIKSIIQNLGEEFARIRIGVANEHSAKQDTADFVLSNFSREESKQLPDLFTLVEASVNKFISGDFDQSSHSL